MDTLSISLTAANDRTSTGHCDSVHAFGACSSLALSTQWWRLKFDFVARHPSPCPHSNVDRAFRNACRMLEIKMLKHCIHMAVMRRLCKLGERRTMACIARTEQVASVR